ncbi:putative disease resistance protein RGA3 [Brachypodium distachyon]|nr:putative disease resistance protein RGA3 [Brachypodium distachyon]|eukprot:XP_014756325.2 putative disease resistance protein RGA3 [Brachypodium distachyon]
MAADLARHLDELEYYGIREKIKRKNFKSSNPLVSKVKSFTEVGQSKPRINRSDIPHIRDTVENLHKICDDVHNALLLEKLDGINRATRKTSTDTREAVESFTETKVFSREEKDGILKLISSSASSGQELLVVPIVGDGGVGKTTLARLVYHDPDVKAKFNIRIWVYVSASFDEVKLTQSILEQIPECEHTNTQNLTVLQRGIKEHLTKRFLLVLDDMWEESEGRWDKLLAPLRCTEVKGNVILVTTRKLSVASITSKMEEHINLDGMKDDIFWCFFKRCIFGDENYQGQKKLQKIGKQIATKLKGNPLAAKSVSTLLRRNLHEVHWRKILDSDEWKLQNGTDGIIPALMLSYNHLSYHLQLLFSHCALFPKGYKFDKEQLIRVWIALGFLIDERRKLEDAGSDSFDDLVDRSFLQKDGQYFVVHDLIHDVAREVSLCECLTIDGSDHRKVFPSIRHLGIWTELVYKEISIERSETFEEKLEEIQNSGILRSLESLMLVGVYDENFSAKFVKTLQQSRYVRVLQLSAMPFNADVLLSSVKKFIHLRYLELRSTSDMRNPLPEAICKLYHLQVLDIIHWSGLDDLPKGMSNLVNLRYLLVPESGSLHSKISRVGELKFLQELNEFRVQRDSGFAISQLEYLNEIRGSLIILDLENATKKEEANRARIKDKKHLRTLSLSWGSASGNPSVQREVIEGLKPHDYLAHLHVINYAGATPSWLGENFSLGNLESLHLQDCSALKVLPPFEELPFLKKLHLTGLSSLKEFNVDFNRGGVSTGSQSCEEDELELSEVEIAKCSALTRIRLHSCKALTKLSVTDCGALSCLEGLPPPDQLKHCVVKGCPQLPANNISS